MESVQLCGQCGREVEVYCQEHPEAPVEVIRLEDAPHLQACSHCGQALSPVNIRLALEDIGGGLPLDKITLCCPGHIEDTGCPDYRDEHRGTMAYWYMI